MSALVARVRRHPVATYFLVAFAISWTGVALVFLRTGTVSPDDDPRWAFLVFALMLLGPTAAGLGVTALVDGRTGLADLFARLGRWRVAPRFSAALLVAPLMVALSLLVMRGQSPAFTPAPFVAASPGAVIVTALVVGLVAGLFEELGWTGFATPKMLERRTLLRAGLELGVLWMTWHVLADVWGAVEPYGRLYLAHLALWFVALASYRVFMTWLYAQTGSLLLGVLMHASFTGSQALLGPRDLTPTQSIGWYAIFAAGMAAVALVVALGERREVAAGGPP